MYESSEWSDDVSHGQRKYTKIRQKRSNDLGEKQITYIYEYSCAKEKKKKTSFVKAVRKSRPERMTLRRSVACEMLATMAASPYFIYQKAIFLSTGALQYSCKSIWEKAIFNVKVE